MRALIVGLVALALSAASASADGYSHRHHYDYHYGYGTPVIDYAGNAYYCYPPTYTRPGRYTATRLDTGAGIRKGDRLDSLARGSY
jgi:hypothetical protein